MITSDEIALILGMGFVTFVMRYPVMALVGRFQMPESIIRALRYVPPAVLTAIVAPSILMQNGQLSLSPTSPQLIGGIVAMLSTWRTKNLLLTIILGMAAFYLVRTFAGS